MEKIERDSTKDGEQKSGYKVIDEIWDKLDEIVEWINKQEAEE